jgi:glucose-6-phosphate 1-dehydrogenase
MKKIDDQATIFIIYGATGDLSHRKLIPALYNLFLDGWMTAPFALIGTGRTELSNEDFRSQLLESVNKFSRTGTANAEKWSVFSANLFRKCQGGRFV